jgi:hypothetical protein
MVPFSRVYSEPPPSPGAASFSAPPARYERRTGWWWRRPVTDHARFLIFILGVASVIGVMAVVLWHG